MLQTAHEDPSGEWITEAIRELDRRPPNPEGQAFQRAWRAWDEGRPGIIQGLR